MAEPLLSVVIPTRDRREVLAATLEALAGQERLPGPFEVVVVDDGSTDGSADWLEASDRPGLDLRCLRQPASGPAAARNRGIAAARAARVLLLGDDTLPRPGTLAAHLERAAGREVAVQGRIDWDPRLEVTPVMRFLAPAGPQFYFTGLSDGQVLPWSALLASNLSAPTRFFREEPFDERFPNAGFEDTELAYRWARRRFPVLWSEGAACWHRHRYESIEPFLARQRAVGGAARLALRLHPAMGGRTVLQPAAVGLVKLARCAARLLVGRLTLEERWDLRCRWSFLRGVVSRASRAPVLPSRRGA